MFHLYGKMSLFQCFSFFVWFISLIRSVAAPPDPWEFRALDNNFCIQIKKIRSIYTTIDGFEFNYYDTRYNDFRKVFVMSNLIKDELYKYETRTNEFVTSSVILPQFAMQLQIAITNNQINGIFSNYNEEKFLIYHAAYFQDYQEIYAYSQFYYDYSNRCYLYGCISDWNNFFRAFRLGFCHDTKFTAYSPLKQPCYTFSGHNTSFNYFCMNSFNQLYQTSQNCPGERTIYRTANFCHLKNESHETLNYLFPKEFSEISKGGMFRALAYINDTLVWIENKPFRYRYLQNIQDPYYYYGDQWKELDKNTLPNEIGKYIFSGALIFPRYGNELDQLYFMLLPKELTIEAVSIYRKVKSLIPLQLFEKNYTLEEIIRVDCAKLSENAEETSSNPQIIAATLVIFMIVILIVSSLMTTKVAPTSSISMSNKQIDHTQSVLLEKLQTTKK